MDSRSRRTKVAAALAVLAFVAAFSPPAAVAQASLVGSTTTVIPWISGWGSLQSDSAYDPVNNVYLVVGGRGMNSIRGAFVAPDGTPIGSSFTIAQLGDYYEGVRVAYGSGGFLVAWQGGWPTYGDIAIVWARAVAYNGGNPLFLSDQSMVTSAGVKGSVPVGMAYSTGSGKFLVAFSRSGPVSINARLVTPSGGVLQISPNISVTASASTYDEFVSVGYSPTVDEFLVGFRSYTFASDDTQMIAKRVKASTGEVVAQRISFDGPTFDNLSAPSIVWDPSTSMYFVGWWRGARTKYIAAKWIDTDGNVGGRYTLAVNVGSYDSYAMARSPVDGTYLAVAAAAFPDDMQIAGVHVLADGTAEAPIVVSGNPPKQHDGRAGIGNWDPRVSADTSTARWLASTAQNQEAVAVQLVQSGPGGGPGISFSKTTPSSGTSGWTSPVSLAWGSPDSSATYEVCVDSSNNNTCDTGWQSVGSSTSTSIGSLANGTYYWQVRATVGSTTVEANAGVWWSFTVGVSINFAKQSPSNGATGQGSSVSFSWSSAGTGATYEGCLDTSNNNTCDTGWQSLGTATSWTLSGLANGTYYWQVRATISGTTGEANGATWWNFSVGTGIVFSKQGPANGATGVGSSPTLSWTSAGNAGYSVCVDTINDNTCNTSWQPVGGGLTRPLSGLAPGTHYWQVRAQVGALSDVADGGTWWSFTVGSSSSFTKQTPTNGTGGLGSTVPLTWSSAGTGATYSICADTSNNSTCDTGWQSVGTATSGAFTALAPGTYYWQVRAVVGTAQVDADGGAWYSFAVAASGPSFAKQGPADGASGLGSSVTLSWTSAGDAGYSACVDTINDGTCNTSWQPVGGGLTRPLTGLANGTYYWQVRAQVGSAIADADSGTWWSFTVGSAVSFAKQTPTSGAGGLGGSVALTWSSAGSGATYAVCADTSNNSTCDTSWQSIGTGTTTTLAGFAPGTYFWQVRGTVGSTTSDADGGTWWSFTVTSSGPSFAKQGPANGASGLGSSVTLSWTSAGDAGYSVCVDTVDDGTCNTSWQPIGGGLNRPLTGLANGTYYWQVRAQVGSATADADAGAWWSFTVGSAVSFVKQTPASGTGGLSSSVALAWASAGAGATYAVCVDTSNNSTCDTSWQSIGTGTTTTLTSLAPGTYYWQARATLGSTTSEANGGVWWSFTVATSGPSFAKQGPANGAVALGSAVTLSWTSAGDAGYWVCIDTVDDGTCNTSWQPIGGGLTRPLTGLANGTYYWQVRAQLGSSTGEADGGAWWSFTVGSGLSFAKQTPTNGAGGVASTVALTWTSAGAGGTYVVCVDTSNNNTCDASWQSVGTGTTTTLTGLAAGTYYWQVRGTVGSTTGDADGGAWWSFTVPPAGPSFAKQAPANGVSGLGSSVTLSWTSAGDAGYSVCIDTIDDGTCNTSWQPIGGGLTRPLVGLANGTYYWQIRAQVGSTIVDADGGTWWSFTVGSPVSFAKQTPASGAGGLSSPVALAWASAGAGATYSVCVDTSNNNACDTSWQPVGTGTTTTLTSLAPATYYWQVRATVGATTGEANGGTWWSFSVAPTSTPVFVKQSPANAASGLGSSVTLTWSSAGDAGYWVCIDTVDDGACNTSWQPVGGGLSRPLTGLGGGTYYWQIRAQMGSTAVDADSGTWYSFTVTGPPPPSFGVSFSKTAPADGATGMSGSPTLTWTSAGDAGYWVCIDTVNDNTCNTSWQPIGGGTSRPLSGLVPGTYYWQIRAQVGSNTGEADGGTWWSFTVGSPPDQQAVAWHATLDAGGRAGSLPTPRLASGAALAVMAAVIPRDPFDITRVRPTALRPAA